MRDGLPSFTPELTDERRPTLFAIVEPPAIDTDRRPTLRSLRLARDGRRWQWTDGPRVRDAGAAPRRVLSLPLLGDELPEWSTCIVSGSDGLAWIPRNTLTGRRLAVPGAGAPVVTDLDRDSEPELWFFSGGGGRGLPRVVPATVAPDAEAVPLGRDSELHVRGAAGIVAFDLDEDQFEDLIVLRRGRASQVLENRAGFELRSVEEGLAPGDSVEPLPAATALRLGPVRGEIQWALAWNETAAPVLLSRKSSEVRFTPETVISGPLRALRVRDARILDLDEDGRDELVLLAVRVGTDEKEPTESELSMFRLPAFAGRIEALGRVATVPAGRWLRVGDVDADGALDLLVAPERGPVRVWRNRAATGAQAYRVTLADYRQRGHAVGSYVELWQAAERLLRVRWPPQDPGDQLVLSLAWQSSTSRDRPELRVTWSDGNTEVIETERPGEELTRIHVRR